jgi:hypothetical protein
MMPPVTVRERVLEAVREEPGITAAELAQELRCTTNTASRFAGYWCEQGQLVRQQMKGRDGLYRWCYRAVRV